MHGCHHIRLVAKSGSSLEAGNGLSGPARDLVLSTLHLVELAKGYVDKSLDTLVTH
ncbi:hypothetical protein [Pseudomonas sp. FSL W7-0098]|uniref:hypothetical protein n=1 Tax=Pseudomonas sp. FSL W7-0098 TaxID=2496120 RepID=UPI001EE8698B|nr:hypothetical protein [Pseudomonas sp. FSL W7-0098]